MTDNADLRRLAEQMIVDEDVAAILALLDDLQRARSLHFAVGQDLDEDQAALQAAERRVAALMDANDEQARMLAERDRLQHAYENARDDRLAAERRVASLTDALASAEARVSGLEEALRALDEPLQWLNDHYHKAFVEMPTYIYRHFGKARALLERSEEAGS